jgi:hypothetical protein
MTMSRTRTIVVVAGSSAIASCGLSDVEGVPFYLIKGSELCQLHPDSIVT